MKRFKTPRGAFFLFLAIGCVLLAYYMINVKIERSKPEDYVQMTKVQEVLSRDLKTNYPQTPKEVIKYYSELTKCFYNEKYTDEEFEALAMKANGIGITEIARLYQVPPSHIGAWISRAKRKLKSNKQFMRDIA